MILPPYNTIKNSVKSALYEDLAGKEDITSLLIPEKQQAKAYVITRENMLLCGQAWIHEILKQIDATIRIKWNFQDGDFVQANNIIYTLKGLARKLLAAERTMLNFLQLLSGTATTTYEYSQKIKRTNVKLLDSRKTIPGMRLAQKYAVRCGGGHNHRMGLYDAFLIKENHIKASGSISKAISKAKKILPNKIIEIEVEDLDELKKALFAKPNIIMLDNFTLKDIKKAVAITNKKVQLEVSGNVTLNNIESIAKTGVDYISVGALTKNIKAIDLSMRLE